MHRSVNHFLKKSFALSLVIAITLFASVMFISCNQAEKTETSATTETVTPDDNPPIGDTTATDMNQQATAEQAGKNVLYTCSMHPEVQSDKPGKCPKCGMELVVKK